MLRFLPSRLWSSKKQPVSANKNHSVRLALETLEERITPYTMTNGPGDASATFTLNDWGQITNPAIVFDPLVGTGTVNYSWASIGTYYRIGTSGNRPLLQGIGIAPPMTGTPTNATTSFTVPGLSVNINLSLMKNFTGTTWVGTTLMRAYTITNAGASTIDFELVGFADFHPPSTSSCPNGTGGSGAGRTVYEVDAVNGAAGYSLSGGNLPTTNRFQTVRSWFGLAAIVSNGTALDDTVEGDTNSDGVSDPPYGDGGIAIRDTLTLAPGTTGTLTLGTFVGPGVPIFSNVTVTQSGGSTDVTEAATTDTYTVVLTSAPTGNVTLTPTLGSQLSVTPSTLTFTAANWNVPQTVTVSASNNGIADGLHTSTITYATTSSDTNYNGISVDPIIVNISDPPFGVTLTQSGGSTSVAEGGATDTYTLVLDSVPLNNVTITLGPDANVTVSPSSLIFTPANWNTAQTVTVTAFNDSIVQGTHTGTITHTATSSDGNYNGISVPSVTANITDNDTVGVIVTQTGGSTDVDEGGATDSYTVVLNSQPTAPVTITLNPDAQVTTVPATLVFTAASWNLPQTVNVAAVDDSLVEGFHTGTITHTAASGDTAYNGITVASVTANISDNDVPPGVTGGGTLFTPEGGPADFYNLVLDSRPLANVIITLNPDKQVKVSPTTLTFTPLNWHIPQKVTVTAIDDTLVEGPHTGTITHSVLSGDPAYNNFTIPAVTANITDNDSINGVEGSDIIKVVPSTDHSLVLVTVNGKTGTVLGSIAQVPIQAKGGNDTITVNTPAVPVFVDGGNNTDTLIVNGQAGNNTFVLTASSLSVNGVAINWANIESLTINGQAGNDTFVVQGLPAFPVTFYGNAGTDSVRGPDSTNLWQINGITANAGILDSTFKYVAVENLTGGSGNDTFLFSAGKGITGKIDGGQGTNLLDYSLYTTAVTVNLQTSTSTGNTGFQNIATVLGGKSTLDKLLGPNQATTWNIAATNSGAVNGLFFFAIENLTGGSGDDTFTFADGRGITGKLDGGAGTDLLDYTAYTTPVSVNLGLKKATGMLGMANIESVQGGNASPNTLTGPTSANTWILTGTDTGTVAAGLASFAFTGMDTLIGGSGADTFTGSGTWSGKIDGGLGIDILVGDDSDHAWDITGLNAGTLDGRAFAGMENLRGGTGDDTFALAAGQKISGKLDGGTGSNSLDYSAFLTAVTINLQLKTATNTGSFSNIGQFTGGNSGLDTLVATNLYNAWNLTGANAGDLTNANGTYTFSGFKNLTGGSGTDLFNLTSSGSWTGMLNGGLGQDTLSAFAGSTWTTFTVNGNKFTGIETRQ